MSAAPSSFLPSGAPGREGLKLAAGVEGSDYPQPAPRPSLPSPYWSGRTTEPLCLCPTPNLLLPRTHPRRSPSRVVRSRGAAGRLPVPCSASSSSCCCRACCRIRRLSRGPTYSSSSSPVPRPRRFSRAPARTASPARICSARGACFSWPPAPRAALNLGIFLAKSCRESSHVETQKESRARRRCVRSVPKRPHSGTAPPTARRPGGPSTPPHLLRARGPGS